MARAVKAGVLKKAKVLGKKSVKKAGPVEKSVATKKVAKAKAVVEVKKATEQPAIEAKKKISEKLLEAMEKRKAEQGQRSPFGGRPMGRRGRRPKNMADYTPMSEEQEDSYVLESENENLEYDTGIRVSGARDDGGFSLDRVDDFDEELNFDW